MYVTVMTMISIGRMKKNTYDTHLFSFFLSFLSFFHLHNAYGFDVKEKKKEQQQQQIITKK